MDRYELMMAQIEIECGWMAEELENNHTQYNLGMMNAYEMCLSTIKNFKNYSVEELKSIEEAHR